MRKCVRAYRRGYAQIQRINQIVVRYNHALPHLAEFVRQTRRFVAEYQRVRLPARRARRVQLNRPVQHERVQHVVRIKRAVFLIFLYASAQDGMGVVEVILIIVVLIGLVIIFQTNIKGVVASIFSTIQKNAGSVR